MTRAPALATDRTAAVVCVAVLLMGSAFAQSKPDFSGRWVLADPGDAPSTVAVELTVEQTAQSTSVRGAQLSPPLVSLTMGRRFKDGVTRLESYTIGIVGGTSSGVIPPNRAGSETRYATRWEGANIVIETSSYSGDSGVSAERAEVWSRNTPNTLRIIVTERGTGIESRTTTAIYRHP